MKYVITAKGYALSLEYLMEWKFAMSAWKNCKQKYMTNQNSSFNTLFCELGSLFVSQCSQINY
jgi:ribulose bisphosphate carboxylase small subunit